MLALFGAICLIYFILKFLYYFFAQTMPDSLR